MTQIIARIFSQSDADLGLLICKFVHHATANLRKIFILLKRDILIIHFCIFASYGKFSKAA